MSTAGSIDRHPMSPHLGYLGGLMALALLSAWFHHGLFDVFCSLIAVYWLALSAMGRTDRWWRQGWAMAMLGWWAVMVLRSAWLPNPWPSLSITAAWVRWILLVAAWQAAVPALTDRAHRRLRLALALGLSVAVLECWCQWWLGQGLVGWILGRDPYREGYRMWGTLNRSRIGIIMVHWCWVALCPWMLQSWTRMAWSSMRSWLWPGWSLLAALLVGATVLITRERMALLLWSLGFGFVGVMILWRSAARWWMLGSTALLLSGMVVWAMTMTSLWERQVLSTVHVITHLFETSYGQLWEAGWRMGWASPWWGGGVHQFREECLGWMRLQPETWCNLHPHHVWLEIWAESGILGLGCAWVSLGAMLRRAWLPASKRQAAWLWWGLGITAALRCFPLTASTSFFANWSAGAFWIVLGWWMGERDRAMPRPV